MQGMKGGGVKRGENVTGRYMRARRFRNVNDSELEKA